MSSLLFPNHVEVLKRFEDNVRSYCSLFKKIPLKGEHFEELMNNAFKEANPTSSIIWNANGHGSGKDITIDGIELSLKSCTLPKDHKSLEYSSFRTTRLKTLAEKIEFLDRKHYDHVLCLMRKPVIRDGGEAILYSLRQLHQDFKYSDMVWTEDNINYSAKIDSIKAVIRKSRSDQLLVFLPLSHTTVLSDIIIEAHK